MFIDFKQFLKLCLFLERGKREKERESNINMQDTSDSVASCPPPTGDLACNPGMCPDWESNPQPFGAPDNAPTKWATPARAFLTERCVFQKNHQSVTILWSSSCHCL